MKLFLTLLSALWLCTPLVASAVEPVAVLELSSQSKLPPATLDLLTDAIRSAALDVLPSATYTVMTRDNMLVMLEDMGLSTECVQGNCEVETGRNIGAKLVVAGSVTDVEGTHIVSIKLYDCASGSLLAAEESRGQGQLALLDTVKKSSRTLFQKVMTEPAAPAPFVSSLLLQAPDRGEVELTAQEGSSHTQERGWGIMQVRLQCSNDESPTVAGQRAARAGRLAFLHQALGVNAGTLQVLHSDVSVTLAQRSEGSNDLALAVNDGNVETKQQEAEHGGGYWLHRRSGVRLFDGLAARAAGLDLGITLERSRLAHGDMLSFRVRSSRSLKLFVLSLSQAGTSWLLPGPGGEAAAIVSGAELAFPTPFMKENDLTLQVGLSKGEKQANEAVLVLGVDPRHSGVLATLAASAELPGLFDALSELPAGSWGFAAASYRIERP